MEKIKRRRYGAEVWRKILGRFEESGLAAPVFCEREGISTESLSLAVAIGRGSRIRR
jgi:hypothetical protein